MTIHDDYADDTIGSCSYAEACAHAEDNYRRTNGMITGGGYMVRMDDGEVIHVELRITESGIARPLAFVRDKAVAR
jgi:hypothetical protein